MKWAGERAAIREVGNDPNAWLEKQLEAAVGPDCTAGAGAVNAARSFATWSSRSVIASAFGAACSCA